MSFSGLNKREARIKDKFKRSTLVGRAYQLFKWRVSQANQSCNRHQEQERRCRQIESGQLTASNGLVL